MRQWDVYRADVGMSYGRPPMAAVLENDQILVFDPATSTLSAAIAEAPEGEGWPAGEEDLSDHQLERFLEKAEIKKQSTLDASLVEGLSALVLDLEEKDMKLRALYGNSEETAKQAAADGRKARRMYQNQVAALKPFGAHKGYGLSLINELVAGFIGASKPTLRSKHLDDGDKDKLHQT